MNKVLDVRRVGWLHNLKNDTRSPESFTFPACMTSLMECIGEDAKWISIEAHQRQWTKRCLYNDLLAVSGMSFGFLWHEKNCPSCMDLTQVHPHDQTIAYAFNYMGYRYDIVERSDKNQQQMKQLITNSINAGYPVLAFGIVGPPECSIIAGYENDGDTLLGWSHFQSCDPTDCAENGMFRKANWHSDIWKIVICKEKIEADQDLKEMIRRGCEVMEAKELSGYSAGFDAYDAWMQYITDPSYDSAGDDVLQEKYWLHHAITGNHAEARCYLGNFLADKEDELLKSAAQYFSDIHDTCWKIWGAAGGIDAPDGFKALREKAKREEIKGFILQVKELDQLANAALRKWLEK